MLFRSPAVFYAACKQLLTINGIIAINVWGSNRQVLNKASECINLSFNHRVLYLPVKGRGNVIAFAFANDFPSVSMQQLQACSELLGAKFSVEYPKFLKDLKRHNRKTFKQFITK